ncbi:CBS domain-containing protein [Streptomyces sp. NPDC006339]|uniref:CBS domain-containing protein n=1 Tax=Streptomyces sp. NPDC006339 TaxID=3156755 RepID=UPI0033B11D15
MNSTPTTETDAAPDEPGPHVWDDMTVEVALAVLSSARARHLVVRDDDGRRTGLVTRAQLTGFRASAAYTDRVRLRTLLTHPSSPLPVSLLEVPCAASSHVSRSS